MVRWEKRGRIFVPDGSISWMRTHATLPVAVPLDDVTLRILFAGRDDSNRSRIGWIDVDARDPSTVRGVSEEPILPLGDRGTFDDNGMTPSCVVQSGSLTYLYYIGWNPQVTVSYRLSIGLAVSEDGGRSYRRFSDGPILDRDRFRTILQYGPVRHPRRESVADVVRILYRLGRSSWPSRADVPCKVRRLAGRDWLETDRNRLPGLRCSHAGHRSSLGCPTRRPLRDVVLLPAACGLPDGLKIQLSDRLRGISRRAGLGAQAGPGRY